MRRSALTSLSALLRTAAAALGVERAAHEALIAGMWPEIAGPQVAAHARMAELRGSTLLLEVDPGLWVQEVSARRGQFVEAINRRLGARVIAEIRIRSGRGTAAAPREVVNEKHEGEPRELSAQELAAIDSVVVEIADPQLREAARRAMRSEMLWRKRRKRE